MLRSWVLLAIAAAVIVGGFYLNHELQKTRARYAVEVTLAVNGEQVSGRTVMEGHWWISHGLGRSDLNGDIYGEAIPLTLAGLGTVFVLRRSEIGGTGAASGGWLLRCSPKGSTLPLGERVAAMPPCEIRDQRPMLAINRGTEAEPRMQRVYYSDDGGPITLVRFAVEKTDEPVTRGLTATFPWLKLLPTIYLPISGTLTSPGLIYREDFSR